MTGTCVRRERTPQGGPLSPLANLLLDDLDQELERRGHRCRYADDCNIHVQSQAASERVLASVTAFFGTETQVAGQPREKRSSASLGTKIPGPGYSRQTRSCTE
jgi:hypothetical protein